MNTNDLTAGGQQIAIEMRGVGVLREGRWIVKDVDFVVQSGTLAAILGPNGSGKSTLARIAGCYLWPTAGRCSILGQTFGSANLPELRRDIRLVQPAGPYDVEASLKAAEVVQTGFFGCMGLFEDVTAEMISESQKALQLVGLGLVMDQVYSSLSSGEKVRSLLARAMVTQPKLLILDEPTSGLDVLAREQVLATVQALLKSRHAPAVLLITHHIEELPPVTSQVLLMKEGRVAARGSMSEVLKSDIISDAHGFPVKVRLSNGRYYLEVHPSAWKDLLPGIAGDE